jgi:hypothetical protein
MEVRGSRSRERNLTEVELMTKYLYDTLALNTDKKFPTATSPIRNRYGVMLHIAPALEKKIF